MATALFITNELPKSQVNDYQCTLESWGLFDNLLFGSDGTSALNLLEKSPVDAVLYPWQETDSASLMAFLETMQTHDLWAELPVLVMTERDQTCASLVALEYGAADCLAWHLPAAECQARVRTHLKLRERLASLRNDNQRLTQLALTDMLTGLYNRGYFDIMLENEIVRGARNGRPMSLLMIDLDNFKQINDTFGHQCGDNILQMVARAFKATCRKADVVCRYGGDEFTLILPETDALDAFALAERIRENLSGITAIAGGEQVKVSATIGISCSSHAASQIDARTLLEQADSALYAGKRHGRNCTENFDCQGRQGAATVYPAFLHAGYGHS